VKKIRKSGSVTLPFGLFSSYEIMRDERTRPVKLPAWTCGEFVAENSATEDY